MGTRTEKRKQAKLERREMRNQSHRRRKILVGAGSLLALGLMVGTGAYSWQRSQMSRGPASSAQGAEAPSGGMSLEEAAEKVSQKNRNVQKAQEWLWAEAGQTERVIEAYEKVKGMTERWKEERARLISTLGRTVRPKDQWPPAFSEKKAKDVLAFLEGLLGGEHKPGAEAMTSVTALVAYAIAIPQFRSSVEKSIIGYYKSDERPGPRAGCLDALSKIHSEKAIAYLKVAASSKEHSTSHSALYSLANYLRTPLAKGPREILLTVARTNAALRPLAVKLLAYHQVRSVASVVPKLLHEGAGPAEIEAGAYAIEQLKLQEHQGLMEKYGRSDSPFLQKQLDAAKKSIETQ